ncbi:MAG TPA: MFS transporter [Methylomirabilota bacterium]|nr:MFS transporter [Methylomirabilota bacterium]
MIEPSAVRRARWAVAAVFLMNGAQLGTWAPQIPVVKERLGLSEFDLGIMLLVMAIGAAVAMPFSGLAIARSGSAPITRWTILLQVISLPMVVLAPTYPLLLAAAVAFGAGTGLSDVGMNAQAVAVEKRLQRPVMSSLHGMFSVGGFIAASAGGLILANFSPEVHVAIVAAVSLSVLAVMLPRLLPGGVDRAAPGTAFALPTRSVAVIGVLTFVVFMAEGAMIDWSAVYLGGELGASPSLAAAGYAAFAGGMAIGRFGGDIIRARSSAVLLVRAGALAASVSILTGAASGSAMVLIVGLGVAGLGLSNIIPVLFSAAGRTPGQTAATGVAAVATTGYFGLLVGPPLIGFIAEWSSLAAAFLMLGVAVFVVALAASAAGPADDPTLPG